MIRVSIETRLMEHLANGDRDGDVVWIDNGSSLRPRMHIDELEALGLLLKKIPEDKKVPNLTWEGSIWSTHNVNGYKAFETFISEFVKPNKKYKVDFYKLEE